MTADIIKSTVVITGANGQVGRELQRHKESEYWNVYAVSRAQLDITNVEKVNQLIESVNPEIIINTAAYTAVEQAESEKDLAYKINAEGAANLAKAAHQIGSKLVHLSTDYVFDGKKCMPYKPDDEPAPLNVYGASKLIGENMVQEAMAGEEVILRTSWVYSAYGSNFVKTMLRLMSERNELSVIADQIGSPTWAGGLAESIWNICRNNVAPGIYHWSDAGVASWYDFAVAIYEEGRRIGLLTNDVNIKPISASEYQSYALRPNFSVLDCTSMRGRHGGEVRHWRESLKTMLQCLLEQGDEMAFYPGGK